MTLLDSIVLAVATGVLLVEIGPVAALAVLALFFPLARRFPWSQY